MPGTLDARDIVESETDRTPCLGGAYILMTHKDE